MNIEMPDELVARLRQLAANANGANEADILRQALDTLDWMEEDPLSPDDLDASLEVIDRSMEEMRAGKSLTIEEARRLTKKNLGLTAP